MNRTLLIFGIVGVLGTFETHAQEPKQTVIENWRCYDRLDFGKSNVLVKLARIRQQNGVSFVFGKVSVAGITHRTRFKIAGFERRWDFGENLNYAFVINPNGDGAYYDFSRLKPGETTTARQLYNCNK